jgi:hypothetical protein
MIWGTWKWKNMNVLLPLFIATAQNCRPIVALFAVQENNAGLKAKPSALNQSNWKWKELGVNMRRNI